MSNFLPDKSKKKCTREAHLKISVVTTLYRSEELIEEFYLRLSKELKKITENYEVIFVDDGSPDLSTQKVLEFKKNDSKVKLIELSRNFGHHKALICGLNHASGDFIFMIDSDLEEDPELISTFWEFHLNNPKFDCIYGIASSREDSYLKRISSQLFWNVFNRISGFDLGENPLTIRLMSKRFVQNFSRFQEQEVFFGGINAFIGFNQTTIKVQKSKKGSSSYSILKLFSLALNAISSFSSFPLIVLFFLGLFILISSLGFGTYIILNKFINGVSLPGWTSLMVISIFNLGCIMTGLGLIGLYVAKIYNETKNRPQFIIKKIT